jgi:hypothetical protein
MQSLTPNKQHTKRGVRRVRQNKTPGSDAITLKGKQRVTQLAINSTTGAIDYALLVTPSVLGDRVAGIAQYWARFRINSLKFILRSKMPTTATGTVVCGVLDDSNSAAVGSSSAQVLDYRISSERHVYQDQTLRWSPLDKNKWYYTQPGADSRLQYPCTYMVASDDSLTTYGTYAYSVDLHYSITFEGSAPQGYAVRDYVSVSLTPKEESVPQPPSSKSTPPSGYFRR